MNELFKDEAERLIAAGDVETVRRALVAQMKLAGMEYLENGKNEAWEFFEKFREQFDGSEYQQGKKDGIRTTLAFLGNPELLATNRGGAMGRESEYRKK